MRSNVPVVLTVAGLDPSSGAGITADLKTIAAHGMFGVCCPTVLTVQSTQGVLSSEAVRPGYLTETLRCLADDTPFAAIKLGALGNVELLSATIAWLRQASQGIPVVLDPVFISSSGHPLLDDQAIRQLATDLLPLVTVVTPNVMETAALLGRPLLTQADVAEAAQELFSRMGASTEQRRAVLITGGDMQTDETAEDYLHMAGDSVWLKGERVDTRSTHGTGCAFSTAIACGLAAGQSLEQSARNAKAYVRQALLYAYPVGRQNGHGPLNHLFRCDGSHARQKSSSS